MIFHLPSYKLCKTFYLLLPPSHAPMRCVARLFSGPVLLRTEAVVRWTTRGREGVQWATMYLLFNHTIKE